MKLIKFTRFTLTTGLIIWSYLETSLSIAVSFALLFAMTECQRCFNDRVRNIFIKNMRWIELHLGKIHLSEDIAKEVNEGQKRKSQGSRNE